jgi:hypothetical protein
MLSWPVAVHETRYCAAASATGNTLEPCPDRTVGAGGGAGAGADATGLGPAGLGLAALAVGNCFAVGVGEALIMSAVGLVLGLDAAPSPAMPTTTRTIATTIALLLVDHPVSKVRTMPTGKHSSRPTTASQLGTPPDFAEGIGRTGMADWPGSAAGVETEVCPAGPEDCAVGASVGVHCVPSHRHFPSAE